MLKRSEIDIYDNFFEVGGDSLLATQLMLGIESTPKVKMSPQQISFAPTIAGLAEILLENQTEQMYISPRNDLQSLALSFAQQQLWLQQEDPHNCVDRQYLAARLTGDLNLIALQQALDTIVERHEVLRTNPIGTGANVVPVLRSPRAVELSVIDLHSDPQPQPELEIERRLQQEYLRNFDLERDLMIRGCWLQVGKQEQILLVTIHPIAADRRSLGILAAQLQASYASYCEVSTADRTPALPELPLQFADFALQQRQWLQGEAFGTDLNYWKQQLAGAPRLLDLPTDRSRPSVQTFGGASRSFTVDRALTSALEKLSQQVGVKLGVTLLAAFEVLLYRYTGSEDLVVGTPSANRTEELADKIGLFANTLVLRTDVSGNPSFGELLDRVHKVVASAKCHQDVPFDLLVRELCPQPDLSYAPLFQVMFEFDEEHPVPQIALTNLVATPYAIDLHTARYDLTLVIERAADSLIGRWIYNPDLFDPSTIDRLSGHFQTLLAGISVDPAQSIGTLPILPLDERDRLLVAWNDTARTYPQDLCLHQLFEQQVALTPDAVALVLAGETDPQPQLTYRELNSRSNQLARYLRALGVKPGVLVGICIERSLDMFVGLLGILKAGGAYVPLDPVYPQDRLSYMLADSQMPLLVTQSSLGSRLPAHSARLVCVDSEWHQIAGEDDGNLTNIASVTDLAYIIYTSGSTGKPKGVQIQHGGVTNLLSAMAVTPGLTDRDIFLCITTISFDMAVPELYLPLSVGAKIALVSREIAADGPRLLQAIDRLQPTVIQATPATWQLLLAVGWTNSAPLKILCGGEALSPKLAERLLARATSVWNMYGPTEATVWATAYDVRQQQAAIAADNHSTSISIGKPLGNIQIYILAGGASQHENRHLQPVPIGISGEIYLGGICLAQGYLNRPELTAEKFIANPFSQIPTDRLYKTGDWARYLPDGNIEYFGRIDNQVKIRGFRIELGEIEASLGQHPAITQATAIVREDRPDDRRLVVYAVADPNLQPQIDELRDFIAQKVPSYMVPSAFVMLAELPMTPNGKVDRRALPVPDYLNLDSAIFVSAQDEIEIKLTQIWERVLGIKPIGIADNFFDLGGHSLLAVHLFNEIDRVWGKMLPLATLVQAPTIAELAKLLRQDKPTEAWSSLVLIQAGTDRQPPLFCIHPVGGNILEYYPLAKYLGAEQRVYGLQSQGLDGLQSPLRCVKEMATQYLERMLEVEPDGPYCLLGYSFGGLVALEIAQQLHDRHKQVAFLALLDLQSPQLQNVRPSISRSIQIHLQNLWQLNAQEKLKYITDRLEHRFKKVDYKDFVIRSLAELSPITPQLLKTIELNLQAERDYVAQPYSGNISLFRCQVQTIDRSLYHDLGWGELVSGRVEVYNIDGSHYGILQEPSVRVVAEQIKQCLAKITTDRQLTRV